MAYDEAADDGKVHQKLHDAGIQPVLQNRAMWKQDSEQMLPCHEGKFNIVYDEAGTLHGYDRVSQLLVRHPRWSRGEWPKSSRDNGTRQER